MLNKVVKSLNPIFSVRFIKYCSVGFSGVGVNLIFLFIFADVMKLHVNLASALAIEISILTNYAINELWTFNDRRNEGSSFYSRCIKFNVVSLIGASMQWAIFVIFNMIWLAALFSYQDLIDYNNGIVNWFDKWIIHPVLNPPDVGSMKYLSQLIGIAVATFWNFLMNYYWTWAGKDNK